MKPLYLLVFSFLIACNHPAEVSVITGKVIGIKDGDTIEVLLEGKKQTIRLKDVDCPEKKQAFGKRAKDFTASLCFGREVIINGDSKRDRYNRIVATVFVDGKNLNEELLKAGLAWHYKYYSGSEKLADLENTARKQKAGLWADHDPVAPWDFRKSPAEAY